MSCQFCDLIFFSSSSISVADMSKHHVVMTAAHNLKCRHILHVDVAVYDKSYNLQKCYEAVLHEADKKGLQSLAVPALGTGKG